MTCGACGHQIEIGDFPFCKGKPEHHGEMLGGPARDDIPGGIWIKNAICNPDGTPKRYDSVSEIRRTARAKGWTMHGETPKDPGDTWF